MKKYSKIKVVIKVIDISKLKLNQNSIDLSGDYKINEELLKNSEIRQIKKVNVSGYITDEYHIYLDVEGIMVLSDSRTLEDIDYKFSFIYDENRGEIEEFLKNYENSLDLESILWENIVLEVPIRVVKDENEDIKLSGDGWELTDHKVKNDDRMAPLKELLKGKE